jgi:hypothetical protein
MKNLKVKEYILMHHFTLKFKKTNISTTCNYFVSCDIFLNFDGLFKPILNMCFLNIIVTKSKNMIILIIELNKKFISKYQGLFDGYFP